MGRKSLQKGKRGEKEFANWIETYLKEINKLYNDIVINPHANGSDLIAIPGLAFEIKRHETLNVNSWWKQCVKQASDDRIPVLAYRQNRQKWQFCIPIGTLWQTDGFLDTSNYITLNEAAFKEFLEKYISGSISYA